MKRDLDTHPFKQLRTVMFKIKNDLDAIKILFINFYKLT